MMLSEQFRTLAMFSMLKDPIPATESGLTMQLKSYKMNNLSLDDLPVIQIISILLITLQRGQFSAKSGRHAHHPAGDLAGVGQHQADHGCGK